MSPAIETILISGYAVALLVVALGLDVMARRAHRRARMWARGKSGRFHRRIVLLLLTVSAGFLIAAGIRQPLDFLVLLPFSLAWAGVAWVLTGADPRKGARARSFQ
ncbi:hypothetical protein VMT65_11155 [Nocardia sp. CDC153]|uniref:hypothetical protein n=1 Tax=Nocardia sp. CDC153 TaxID=3112167 RepID=UPI002DB73674|nr:hypothetical protein [Nocardia sp. CDC153]MEC3953591.1 hypothetical protein [Nocardia sp. CDC153]